MHGSSHLRFLCSRLAVAAAHVQFVMVHEMHAGFVAGITLVEMVKLVPGVRALTQ